MTRGPRMRKRTQTARDAIYGGEVQGPLADRIFAWREGPIPPIMVQRGLLRGRLDLSTYR